MIGYETDNYSDYVNQAQSFRDAFVDLMSRIWKAMAAVAAVSVVFAAPAAGRW